MQQRSPMMPLTGLVLAGGAGRRWGGQDKGLLALAGRPLAAWVAAALAPQCATLLISINRNHAAYRALGYPLVTDRWPGFLGPVAGIASVLAQINTPWLLTAPCDTPLLPADLGLRLLSAAQAQNTSLAIAVAGGRAHFLHALIARGLADDLETYLIRGGRSMRGWLEHHAVATATFDDQVPAFVNLNDPILWARMVQDRQHDQQSSSVCI